jgi:hypothetical protein
MVVALLDQHDRLSLKPYMGLPVSDGSGHVNVRCDRYGFYLSPRVTFDLVLLRAVLDGRS